MQQRAAACTSITDSFGPWDVQRGKGKQRIQTAVACNICPPLQRSQAASSGPQQPAIIPPCSCDSHSRVYAVLRLWHRFPGDAAHTPAWARKLERSAHPLTSRALLPPCLSGSAPSPLWRCCWQRVLPPAAPSPPLPAPPPRVVPPASARESQAPTPASTTPGVGRRPKIGGGKFAGQSCSKVMGTH